MGDYYEMPSLVVEGERKKSDIAGRLGLCTDSKLVEVLSTFDEVDVEKHITNITNYVHARFHNTSSSKMYSYMNVVQEVMRSLDNNVFIENITTPEDFYKYARVIIDVAEACVQRNDDDVIIHGYEYIARNLHYTITDMAQLIRDDFARDLEILVRMINDDQSPSEKMNIFIALRGIDGIIKTSDDLERFGQFIHQLARNDIDAKKILFDPDAPRNFTAETLFGRHYDIDKEESVSIAVKEEMRRYALWQEVITDSKELDKVLSVMTMGLSYEANRRYFVKRINESIESLSEKKQFINLLQKCADKNIPPGFVIDNKSDLHKCNFSQNGIDVLPSVDIQKKLLAYCAQALIYNGRSIEKLSIFFNDALHETADSSLRIHAYDVLKNVIETLYREALHSFMGNNNREFVERIKNLRNAIDGSADILTSVDLDQAKKEAFTHDIITILIPLLDDIETLFPQTFKKIKELLPGAIAADKNTAVYFFENLPKYYTRPWVAVCMHNAVTHYSVANKFIDNFYDNAVWAHEPWVQNVGTDAEITIKNMEEGFDEEGEMGFLDGDKFRDHPLHTIRQSLGLGRVIAGKSTPENAGLKLSSRSVESIREITKMLKSEHQSFLEKVRVNAYVPEEDKAALMGSKESKVKMNNLFPNVCNFVGRYLAQVADGAPQKLDYVIEVYKDSIKGIVREGYKLYLDVYNTDIPLYDKLYKEFDSWREGGRYPMEVYIGRDGIYAYIGRRAQDAIRRSLTGKEKRARLRSSGEIIEINPRYIVYPRYFRDYLKYDVKRAFLEQERITPDMDPLFYDTGYVGTVPEDMMRIMDFDDEDIEERIRLLSTTRINRQVRQIRNMSYDLNGAAVERIESNAKPEEMARGLFIDEKTGKIHYIAKPTTAREQFNFAMIKQALARHYMIQERLHFRVPDNVYYDTESHRIRICREYAKVIPSDFTEDPQKFMREQKAKSMDNEGVATTDVFFQLNDGTEVVARYMGKGTSKYARKEHALLIAAQDVGVPAPEPLGFLSSKDDKYGNYVLTKKVNGYPGKDFEKILRDSKQYTEEEIAGIMSEVSSKLNTLTRMFRDQLNVGRKWYKDDVVIQFDEESKRVRNVVPLRIVQVVENNSQNT